jgi:hypothetical protein
MAHEGVSNEDERPQNKKVQDVRAAAAKVRVSTPIRGWKSISLRMRKIMKKMLMPLIAV